MVAFALAQMVSVAALAQHHRPAMPSNTALHMEQQGIMMQLMDACAPVLMIIVVTTALFHQLAAATSIAMGMPLWTRTAQMAACATATMGGLAMIARSHRRVMLPPTAVVMAQPPTRTRPTVVCVHALEASMARIAQWNPRRCAAKQ